MSTTQAWDFPQFLSTPPPDVTVVPFHVPSEEEEEKLGRLVVYFGREGYVPPAGDAAAENEEKGQGLSDWEMMFLLLTNTHTAYLATLFPNQLVKGRNHPLPHRDPVERTIRDPATREMSGVETKDGD
ncbi:hypothetical protein QFC21_006237 [Naganishia friedmannii]|uniref:Uncharacterized protein n=1 Tax=Naganishia friedmannii TaxID=89922 RepID=A0ACC2V3D9_9TREE|nr:hypothetical protein QFC21_006237 [Naganishia friedmannii]